MNEKVGADDAPMDEPNTTGALLVAPTEAVDAAKENGIEGDVVAETEAIDAVKGNPVEGVAEAVDDEKGNPVEEDVELKEEPNIGDLAGCQLEPNKLEVVLLMALLELASEEEAEEPSPKGAAELKTLAAGAEAANRELPEAKAVFPVTPNDGVDADELD